MAKTYKSVSKWEDITTCKINLVLCESGHLAWPGAMDTRSRDSLENCRLFGANKNCPHRSGAAQKCQFLRRNLLLTIYNLSFASSTHDLEASLGLDLVRGATTRDNLAVTRKRRSPYLRHRLASFLTLVHLSCPCLALLWPKLLAGHNLKLSHFLFGLDHHWLLPLLSKSLAISRPLSTLLWEALVLVWRVVGSTELVKASLTLEGLEALLYLFTPKSQRPLKVPLRMHRKYTDWPLPPPASARPKVGEGGGRPSPASPRARGRRRRRCCGRRVSPPLRLLVMQLWGRARCAVAAAVPQRWMEWRPRVELENDPQCNVCQSS